MNDSNQHKAKKKETEIGMNYYDEYNFGKKINMDTS